MPIVMIFVRWCGVWGLLFGCPTTDGPGWVDAQTQMNESDNAAAVQMNQADNATDQQQIDMLRNEDALRADTEQRRIDAELQAEQLQTQTEQQRIAAHATTEALTQRETTYRAEVLQTAATERLYMAELQRTERLRIVFSFLRITLLLVALFVVARFIADAVMPQRAQPVELPPLPDNPMSMPWPQFWQATEQLPYEIVEDEHGRTIGVLFMNNSPRMYLLEDKQP